jgi:hypothetical protein
VDRLTASRLGSVVTLGRLLGDAELGSKVARELSATDLRSLATTSTRRWSDALRASGIDDDIATRVAGRLVDPRAYFRWKKC